MEMPPLDDLSPVEFEEFCFKLLQDVGFINVDWRKGTGKDASPSDSGRDIVAFRQMTDVDGWAWLEKWFVDCKRYKKGVPPEEITGLLTWSHADRANVALVIASNYLSNPCKTWLEHYETNNRAPFRIRYWERPQLERLVGGKVSATEESGGLASSQEVNGAEEDDDEGPGPLEWLALYEATLPVWAETDNELTLALNSVAELMNQSGLDIKASDARKQGYAGRLFLDRQLAKALKPLVDDIYALSVKTSGHLRDVDSGLREHISRQIALVKRQPQERARVCREFVSTRAMADAILGGIAVSESYLERFATTKSQTSDMRPVDRRLREAAGVRAQGRELVHGWLEIIEGANFRCDDLVGPSQ
jgi:hypothetical protein